MAELLARSPLAGHALGGKLDIAERDCTILGLSVHRPNLEALQQAVQTEWGITLPDTPRRVVAGNTAIIWSGPEKWIMVTDPHTDTPALPATIVELTDSRCILNLSGEHARTALTHLLPIDLHPRSFATNACALTLAGHINIQVWQTSDTPAYDLAVARSLAPSLLHHLELIAAAL